MTTEEEPQLYIRPQAPPPAASLPQHEDHHRIRFLHPAYADKHNLLFNLFAFDAPHLRYGGVHAETAFLACAIVAGNAWEGYLTEKDRHGRRIHHTTETVLYEKLYYFHVPPPAPHINSTSLEMQSPSAYKYAVYPSFKHWTFPHESLPPHWPDQTTMREAAQHGSGNSRPAAPPSASNLTPAVLSRDLTCRLTSSRDYVECAHLVPRCELDWFRDQEMLCYNRNPELPAECVVDDMANAVTLRKDVHSAFDDHRFVFTRKRGTWVVHFLQLTNELGPCYHNTEVHLDHSVSSAFLLARFAYAIFPLLKGFLITNEKREVRLRKDGEQTEEVKQLSGVELHAVIAKPRGRSGSPKKRPNNDSVADLEGEEDMVLVTEGSGIKARKKRRRISSPCGRSNLTFSHESLSKTPQSVSPPDLLSSTFTTTNSNTTSPLVPHLEPPAINLGTNFPDYPPVEKDLAASYMHIRDPETRRFAIMRASECRKRRPRNPDLLCCDYDAAERRARAGEEGPRRFGGAHLCLECRGQERVQDGWEGRFDDFGG